MKKAAKRDKEFQSSLLRLDNTWLDNHEHLALFNKINYVLAGQWRPEIYHFQRKLAYALMIAYTNDHKNARNKLGRMFVKGYHLTFGLLLLPACSDKFAQLLREFLEIEEWTNKKEANEGNTSLSGVVEYLEKVKANNKIRVALNKYWNSRERRNAYKLANKVKHRWSQHYLGIKTKISGCLQCQIDKKGKRTLRSLSFGNTPVNEKILYRDIDILKKANNLFVQCVKEIDDTINFYQFYEIKNGVKTLHFE